MVGEKIPRRCKLSLQMKFFSFPVPSPTPILTPAVRPANFGTLKTQVHQSLYVPFSTLQNKILSTLYAATAKRPNIQSVKHFLKKKMA